MGCMQALQSTMPRRNFGPTGVEVAVIGQGTWQVRDVQRAAAAIERGLQLGMTHIDTAELYEQGSGSETMLGALLAAETGDGWTLRDQVFLASKVLPNNATHKGVLSACKDSLVRLATDRIDLYYHHWRGRTPLAETLGALAELKDRGWIKHIGVSNYDVDDLDQALSILGPKAIAANQVLYHLEDRGIEADVVPWCKKHGVAVVGYSTFGAGAWIRDAKRRSAFEAIARSAGCTPRQLALAFLTRDPSVFAIPKAESIPHVDENAGGARTLAGEQIDAIDALFPVRAGLRTA